MKNSYLRRFVSAIFYTQDILYPGLFVLCIIVITTIINHKQETFTEGLGNAGSRRSDLCTEQSQPMPLVVRFTADVWCSDETPTVQIVLGTKCLEYEKSRVRIISGTDHPQWDDSYSSTKSQRVQIITIKIVCHFEMKLRLRLGLWWRLGFT